MMKKILLLIMFVGIAFGMDLSDQNCENSTGKWICQQPMAVSGAVGMLKDNIGCFSTDDVSYDLGCLAAI